MGNWIDFKQLRSQLSFADVLRHYNVEIKAKGSQHHGFCPLPNHNGKKNSQSFSANLEKGIFNCFGCGAKGNLLDFAALMERKDAENGAELREVALRLRDKFCPTPKPASKRQKVASKRTEAEQFELPDRSNDRTNSNVVVNEPLDFELKNLDPKHPYLEKRGFSSKIIEQFGLGCCSKSLLANRIAIPLHDDYGRLLGYAGRIVDDTLIKDDNPKYRFPGKREKNGVVHEFHKLDILYNSHRLTSPVHDLAIVEGFPSVWWLTQMDFPNVVAVMGATMSEKQAEIVCGIVPQNGRIWLIPDGNKAGRQCALSMFEHLGLTRFVRWIQLDEGKQPTDYPGGWLRKQMGK